MDNYKNLIEDALYNALESGDIRNKCKELFKGDGRAIAMLIEIATDNDSARQKISAIIALGALKESRAVKPLLKHLESNLSTYNEFIIEALGEIADSSVIPTLNRFLSKDTPSLVQRQALIALTKMPPSKSIDIDNLSMIIGSDSYVDSENIELALKVLMEIPDTNAVKAVLNSIANYKYLTGKVDWERISEIILQRKQLKDLAQGYDRKFPNNAIASLMGITGEYAITPIIEYSCSTNFAIRVLTATLLGNFNREDSIERLVIMISDNEPQVQNAAAESLCLIGNPTCIAPLIELLKANHAKVIRTAARTLNRLTNKTFWFANNNYNKWSNWYLENMSNK